MEDVIALVMSVLVVSGTFILVGLKGWSNHKIRMLKATGGDQDRLVEAVEQLQDELGAMREDLTELNERVDFTERLLAEAKSRNAIGPGDPS